MFTFIWIKTQFIYDHCALIFTVPLRSLYLSIPSKIVRIVVSSLPIIHRQFINNFDTNQIKIPQRPEPY